MSEFKKRRIFKIHAYDLLEALVYLGRKVTPEDITNHMYTEKWASEDKYDILKAVKSSLDIEMGLQDGPRGEDHYGLRERNGVYWLNYHIEDFG